MSNAAPETDPETGKTADFGARFSYGEAGEVQLQRRADPRSPPIDFSPYRPEEESADDA